MVRFDFTADVERFKERLLKSEIGHRIAKVYHFGSTVRGTPTKDSDVDILVVVSNGERIRERIADILLELQIEGIGPLEPVTADIEDLFPVRDFFLYNVVHYGREVYTMSEDDLRRENARLLMSLADEYLVSARESIENERYRLGLDGAYNAAELAMKGLLLIHGVSDLPGSHGGIVQLFSQKFIKEGIVEADIGRGLNLSMDRRNAARYKYEAQITGEPLMSQGLTCSQQNG